MFLFSLLILSKQVSTHNYREQLGNGNFDFVDVVFDDITSSADGGALFFSGSSGSLKMTRIEFKNVQNGNAGGTIYINTGNSFPSTFNSVCVYNCRTSNNGNFGIFQMKSDDSLQFYLLTIASIPQTGYGTYNSQEIQVQNFTNINISKVIQNSGAVFQSSTKFNFKYANFEFCQKSLFNGMSSSRFEYCDFNRNQYSSTTNMIQTGSSIYMQWCFFLLNTNAQLTLNGSPTIIRDCYFDTYSVIAPNLQKTRVGTSTTVYPTNFDILNLYICYNLLPYTGTMSYLVDETPFMTMQETPVVTPYITAEQTPVTTPFKTAFNTPFNTAHNTPFNTAASTPHLTAKETPFNTPYLTAKETPFNTPYLTAKETPFNTPYKTAHKTNGETPAGTPHITPRASPLTPEPTPEPTPVRTFEMTPVPSESIPESVPTEETTPTPTKSPNAGGTDNNQEGSGSNKAGLPPLSWIGIAALIAAVVGAVIFAIIYFVRKPRIFAKKVEALPEGSDVQSNNTDDMNDLYNGNENKNENEQEVRDMMNPDNYQDINLVQDNINPTDNNDDVLLPNPDLGSDGNVLIQ